MIDCFCSSLVRFNSILVRLKDVHLLRWEDDTEFQFHTGSIKRNPTTYRYPLKNSFQFHTGSIKSDRKAEIRAKLREVSIPYWFD